ncbi:MAG: hypothetical protein CVT64_00915 [Actinobacteria bacterium HGW-Actinobacteria-4]|nr:MAG: hypothetical protein CVT64_00915 [Actinobacteria bacterium HGW-Actinobacteria-4]
MWKAFFTAVRRGEFKIAALTWVALAATVAYSLWPFDLIPDVIPVVGLLDDLGLWGVVMVLANRERQRWIAQLSSESVTIPATKE